MDSIEEFDISLDISESDSDSGADIQSPPSDLEPESASAEPKQGRGNSIGA